MAFLGEKLNWPLIVHDNCYPFSYHRSFKGVPLKRWQP